jgi:glucose uptake protein GlcU
MFLTPNCQRLAILEPSPVDAFKMMRGSPAALVGLSALLGLLIILALLRFFETVLIVQSALPSLLLGLTGAWQLGKHRKAGSLTILTGGLFAPVSYFLLAMEPDYASLLGVFLILEWWSPVLILAGILGLLNLQPRRATLDELESHLEE